MEEVFTLSLQNSTVIQLTKRQLKVGFLLCYDITGRIVHLFGPNILEKAEVAVWCTDHDLEHNERIIQYFSEVLDQDATNGIAFDRENLILTFTTGKQIEIWNSEWGGIRAELE